MKLQLTRGTIISLMAEVIVPDLINFTSAGVSTEPLCKSVIDSETNFELDSVTNLVNRFS